MGITAIFILGSLGFAIIAQAQDCSKPPAGANMDLRDEYITQQTFPDGSKVYFACNSGYTATGGSASITCTAGSWSPVRLLCERKSCGSLGEVPNGQVDYDGNEFGDTATVTCNRGYMLVGRSSFRCEANGWGGRLPTCDAVQCTTPPTVVNGEFYPDKELFNYGEVARYSCGRGFVLNGSNDLTCSDEGKFSPSPPTCVKVQCENPVIENAVFESGSRPPYGHKATVTYSCKPGYKMYGSPTVICNINNQWSPSLPECKREIQPPAKTTTTPTTTITTKKPKDAGDANFPPSIIIVIVISIIVICIVIFFILKKRSRRTRTVKDPAKDDEDVPFS